MCFNCIVPSISSEVLPYSEVIEIFKHLNIYLLLPISMHLIGHFNNTGIASSSVSISIEKALKILLIARPYIQPVKRLLMLQSVVENLNYSHSFKILVKKY